MLRTFCSNPALGGFGGGSGGGGELSSHTTVAAAATVAAPTPDAFCQIIKELVDNAVDACTVAAAGSLSTGTSPTTAKRVRVVIEHFQGNDSDDDEILRVTVSDNGCGMSDIGKCVGAFHTSKAHNATADTCSMMTGIKDSTAVAGGETATMTTMTEAQTAGRYGIGLTLCLLHAQRLVPNSCASIQSAIPSHQEWTVVAAVVDTASDAVRCLPRDSLKKRVANESGTAISILVPGGATATMAWPRLAEYFARFKLSLGITCSLEVLAPTLSRVPLWVRPATISNDASLQKKTRINVVDHNKKKVQKKPSPASAVDDIFEQRNDEWYDRLESDTEDESGCNDKGSAAAAVDQGRLGIWKATQLFLGRPVDLENVAHVIVPIRAKKAKSKSKKKNKAHTGPQLEVDVIVHGPDDESDENEMEQGFDYPPPGSDDDASDTVLDVSTKKIGEPSGSGSSATMVLVRMVNKIPLLDSAEAVACGLVQGLASKKRMWNSFGLDVGLKHDPSNVGKLPTFEVRDSEQVAPFFKKGAHNLLEKYKSDAEQNISDDESDEDNPVRGSKRKRRPERRHLLPASVRLGNVLVIAQIHAEPTTLPLPTLSKGRLPIDNAAIDDALEVGVTKCLQQLQKTNPKLLLTASELRKAERDARYVPAVSLALASILTKSVTNPNSTILERIRRWDNNHDIPSHIVTLADESSPQAIVRRQSKNFNSEDVETLGTLIEGRLRLVLSHSCKINPKTTEKKVEDEAEKDSEKSETSSLDLDLPSVDIPWHLLDQENHTAKKKPKNVENGACNDEPELPGGSMASDLPQEANTSNSGEDYDDWW